MSVKVRQAKRLLAGKGVTREDSDDELGTDDLSWEWIHSGSDHTFLGGRFGDFECRLGDCVLLKAEVAKEAWVAIACDFKETDQGEKLGYFMWFSTAKEIRNKRKKRHDAMAVSFTILYTVLLT